MNNYVLWDDEGRKILGKLAQFIMPLDDWLKKKIVDGYTPPDANDPNKFPWRHGGDVLSVDRLRLIDFIEMLARESANDAFLLHRWAMLEDKPLTFCPIECKEDWREARGLDDDVKFGPVLADNAPGTLVGFPVSRSQLYAESVPHLCTAARARKKAKKLDDDNPKHWESFMLDLFKDKCAEWPEPRSNPSSRFMIQLLRDLLYAVLGMRNPIAEPWRSAVLAEIGEFRRPGNVYDRADIARGVAEFKKVLAEKIESKPTPSEVFTTSEVLRDHYLNFGNGPEQKE
jgi:hypothetical protein